MYKENIVRNKEDIKKLFKKENQTDFDFSQSPDFIRRKNEDGDGARLFEGDDLSRWARIQRGMMHMAKVKSIYSKEYVEKGMSMYDSFFKEKGVLRGDVLDIGGGWGLFRQWWEAGSSNVYIVHDPGIERFLRGAHKMHQSYYQRAFSLPMTFVEGFGETLPYRDDVFDTCIIAAALDHCISAEKVLCEACRCLQSAGGTILILQKCYVAGCTAQPSIWRRLSKHLSNPKRLLAKIHHQLFYTGSHLHHFSPDDVVMLLERAGFTDVRASELRATNDVYAIEAKK